MNKIQPKLFIIAFIIVAFAQAAGAQTSVFTYQGRLTDSATTASGAFDFEFALYEANGNQIGATVTREDVPVTNGVFTVQIDFGAAVFSTAARVLEIRVRRGAETGAFTVLSPRQTVTSAPLAIQSLRSTFSGQAFLATNAENLGGVAANQFVRSGDARLSDARQPLAGSGDYVQNTTTQQASSNFNISGDGTAGGTLSGNTVNSATQFTVGGNGKLRISSTSNILVGALRANAVGGGEPTVGGSGNTYLGVSTGGFGPPNDNLGFDTTGSNNTLIGANTSMGSPALEYATAIGAGASINSNNTVVLGRSSGSDAVIAAGNVSIGGISQVTRLGNGPGGTACRNSNGQISFCSSSLRYKTNVAEFASGLSLINKMRPVTYNWKADGKPDVGFIAEEINHAEPLLTIYNDEGQVEGVKYDRFSAIFVNAFKEQQTQIEQQRDVNQILQTQVERGSKNRLTN